MKSKWITFLQLGKRHKTTIWGIENKNKGGLIGEIKWYPQWRQYTFFPKNETVFAKDCLKDIVEFIKEQMDERKIKK